MTTSMMGKRMETALNSWINHNTTKQKICKEMAIKKKSKKNAPDDEKVISNNSI